MRSFEAPQITTVLMVEDVQVRIEVDRRTRLRPPRNSHEFTRNIQRHGNPARPVEDTTVTWRVISPRLHRLLGTVRQNPDGSYSAGGHLPSERDFTRVVRHLLVAFGQIPPLL